MLSTGAFNALLKTLEEPPKHVKFILATTEPQKLPATILSRCQRFDFKKIPDEDIASNLEKICKECNIDYTEGAINLIAELSEGAMRDALSILERCAQDGESKIDEDKIKELVGIPKIEYISGLVEKIIDYDGESALNITKDIINEGKDLNNLLWEMIKYIRDILIYLSTKELSNIYSKDDVKKIEELSAKTNNERLLKIIYSLSELENDIKWSSQKNIVFQVGILKLCTKQTMPIEERIQKLEEAVKNGTIQQVNVSAKESTTSKQNVDKVSVNKPKTESKTEPKTSSATSNNASSSANKSAGTLANKSGDFWQNIINTLKEERMPMLYSNLVNAKGVLLDDMTLGIEFENGLNSFGRGVIERPENMAELKRLASIEFKKDMRIKLIDKKATTTKENNNSFDIGIDVNMIDG